jgi:hypothetical protein
VKAQNAQQTAMDFMGGFEGTGSLFEMLKFKLNISSTVKNLSTESRYAILSSYTKRMAQWVYSTAWGQLGYETYVYIAVPRDLSDRVMYVSVNPVRKGNKSITHAAVYEHAVALP